MCGTARRSRGKYLRICENLQIRIFQEIILYNFSVIKYNTAIGIRGHRRQFRRAEDEEQKTMRIEENREVLQ